MVTAAYSLILGNGSYCWVCYSVQYQMCGLAQGIDQHSFLLTKWNVESGQLTTRFNAMVNKCLLLTIKPLLTAGIANFSWPSIVTNISHRIN